MISTEDARATVGIIGNITAFILFLSPIPTFVGILKKRSVEQYSAVPYLAALVNCGLWVLYGLPLVHPHSTLVVSVNGVGIMMEVAYLSVFVACSETGQRARLVGIVGAECAFVGALALLVLTLSHSTPVRSDIVGSICSVASILMYASPLSVMKLVINTRSVEYMPFFLSFFSFLNGISWTAYALIRFDLFIAIPNGMGALLGLAQLLLYAIFYQSTKRIMAERIEGEVGLAQVKAQGTEKVGPDTHKNGHVSSFDAV